MDLSVIIVTWNTADLTIECVRRVERELGALSGECLVVDNGSAPEDVTRLSAAIGGSRLIRNADNVGFAAAVNQGLRLSRGRHIVLLNSDAFLGAGALRHLVDYLDANPEVGAVGPLVLHPDGRVQGSARGFPDALSAFFGRRALLTRYFPRNPLSRRNLPALGHATREPMRVDWLSGACVAMRRAAVEEVGGFDERFFMYWEDADICWRMGQRGWQMIYDPRVRVVHLVGGSSERAVLRCTVEFHRSAYRFYRKHLTGRTAHPLNLVAAGGLTARALALVAARLAVRFGGRTRSEGAAPTRVPEAEGPDVPVQPPPLPVQESGTRSPTMARAPVTVVVVNWNAGGHLERCLSALDRQTCEPDEVIVVDNASRDGSASGIDARHRGVRTIALPENVGFAAACNVAARTIRASTWIAMLNPDAVPEPDWLAKLMESVERVPGCASFGSQLILADPPHLLDGTGDIYHVSGLAWRRHHYRPVSADAQVAGEIFAPCAAAALYRRDAFMAAGGFDDRYFCYFEDVDIGFRLRLLGHRAWYVPEARVRHAVSAASGRGSAFYVYHGQRNMVWTYVKNMPGPLLWLYAPQHVLASLVAVAWFSLRGLGRVVLTSKLDSLRGLPEVWRQRREIQRQRRVPLRELRRMMARGWLTPYVRYHLLGR